MALREKSLPKGDKMPKLNTTVKSVRLDNDVLSEIELNGASFNSWLTETIDMRLRLERICRQRGIEVTDLVDSVIRQLREMK